MLKLSPDRGRAVCTQPLIKGPSDEPSAFLLVLHPLARDIHLHDLILKVNNRGLFGARYWAGLDKPFGVTGDVHRYSKVGLLFKWCAFARVRHQKAYFACARGGASERGIRRLNFADARNAPQ